MTEHRPSKNQQIAPTPYDGKWCFENYSAAATLINDSLREIERLTRELAKESDAGRYVGRKLVEQELVLNECEALLREALDEAGFNVGIEKRLERYWAKSAALRAADEPDTATERR